MAIIKKIKDKNVEVLKHVLKNYYKMDTALYPSSGIKKQEDLIISPEENSYLLKMEIDVAIAKLPLELRKTILLHYIFDLPIGKICDMQGLKYRVDAYRRLDE